MPRHWLDDPETLDGWGRSPACNTGRTSDQSDANLPKLERFGVDDLTLGFDLAGSACVEDLDRREGQQTRWGKLLGSSFGTTGFDHLLGRSAAFWRSESRRLYVQAKLAAEGELCPPGAVGVEVQVLRERMAAVGIYGHSEPWVTRLDVAVDVVCTPAWGKALLDGLAGVRLGNGWRVHTYGQPRSTIYFKSRSGKHVLARSYCRNLKTGEGEPYGRIRLEAEQRYAAGELPLYFVEASKLCRDVWESRYGEVSVNVVRLERETQTLTLGSLVEAGELAVADAERMSFFLDAERLGVAGRYYTRDMLMRRRRRARELGLQGADAETINADLEDALAPFRAAWTARG